MEVPTSAGPARVELDDAAAPGFWLVLTHGAGGGVDAPDLLAVRESAVRLGGAVARVLQPYRVRGARAPGPPARQDSAWLEVIEALRERYRGVPLIQGGRSNGARVTCRTAGQVAAAGVVALAFPLRPPWRPERSRVEELRGARAEVLVISGDRDPFGVPDPVDATCVRVMPGEGHDLSRDPAAVGAVAGEWLRRWSRPGPAEPSRCAPGPTAPDGSLDGVGGTSDDGRVVRRPTGFSGRSGDAER